MHYLVVVHVFYRELWPELLACISNLGPDCEVVVTYVDEAAVSQARRDLPAARFVSCENRGFDVWPFLSVLREIDLDRYDAVIKLHTKRNIDFGFDFKFNGCHFSGPAWRERLLSFCRTAKAWQCTLRLLARPDVGMVAERHVIVARRHVPWAHAERAFDLAYAELPSLGGAYDVSVARGRYVAGTMFAVKTEPLRLLLRRDFTADLFPVSVHAQPSDCQYAHVVERLMGLVVGACGLRIAAFNGWPFSFRFRSGRT